MVSGVDRIKVIEHFIQFITHMYNMCGIKINNNIMTTMDITL